MSRVDLEAAGRWIRIQFWDHTVNSDEPALCEVSGRVAKIDSKKIVVHWWVMHDPNDPMSERKNAEKATVLQSAVKRWGYESLVWR